MPLVSRETEQKYFSSEISFKALKDEAYATWARLSDEERNVYREKWNDMRLTLNSLAWAHATEHKPFIKFEKERDDHVIGIEVATFEMDKQWLIETRRIPEEPKPLQRWAGPSDWEAMHRTPKIDEDVLQRSDAFIQ